MFRKERARLDALETRQRDLAESVIALEKRLESLPSDMAAMRADIDLQWEKVQRAIGRLAKRDAVEANATGAPNPTGQPTDEQVTQLILEGYEPWPTDS